MAEWLECMDLSQLRVPQQVRALCGTFEITFSEDAGEKRAVV